MSSHQALTYLGLHAPMGAMAAAQVAKGQQGFDRIVRGIVTLVKMGCDVQPSECTGMVRVDGYAITWQAFRRQYGR